MGERADQLSIMIRWATIGLFNQMFGDQDFRNDAERLYFALMLAEQILEFAGGIAHKAYGLDEAAASDLIDMTAAVGA